MSTATVAQDSARPLVLAGAVVGLTWAAGLRGWMIQMAGDESQFHWYGTFALLLAPGLLVGALIGLAEHRRRSGGSRSPWLALSPCLFLAALADAAIFKALITNGFGGGAIGVVLFGLAGGSPSPDAAERGGVVPAAPSPPSGFCSCWSWRPTPPLWKPRTAPGSGCTPRRCWPFSAWPAPSRNGSVGLPLSLHH